MKQDSLTTAAASLGLTIPRARALAQGLPATSDAETLAAPALKHAYTGKRTNGTSIPAAYELGLRLLARDTHSPIPRRVTSGLWEWEEGVVLLSRPNPKNKNAWIMNGVTVTTQQLHDGLLALVDHPTVPPAVHVATRRDLALAQEALEGIPSVHHRVRALLAWWMEGIDHAGSGVAVDLDATMNSMFATDKASTSVETWNTDMGGDPLDPMGVLSGFITAHATSIPAFVKSARERWIKIRRKADENWLQSRESSADMAAALESMSAASDHHVTLGLAMDPLLQEAALWSGHVVVGTWWDKTASTWTIAAGEAPCRYRSGSQVAVVLHEDGQPRRHVNATVHSLGYDARVGVLVTVHCDGKPNSARDLDRVFDPLLFGADVSDVMIRPQKPDAGRVAESWERARRMRSAADRRSWLRDGDRRPKVRGQMPWDVYLAAAT